MSTNTKPYKETLNLPVTRFEMKANLTTREPEIQRRWAEAGLYQAIRQARKGRPLKVLHDGPPYANGEIHMGHLLNKVLKDFVVRSLTMQGFDSPYVPGWDCHGLPIEHKVVKDLGSKAASMSQSEVRALCRVEALKWVGVQRDQFKRLGVEGDWANPYLTLDPRYEAGILDVLADLLERGLVFRQLKPIHWCLNDRTALAEAELEYKVETTPSIYVNFPMTSGVPEAWGDDPWHAMIWTTTPWTLPANVAIAAHPDLEYAGVRYLDPETGKTSQTILAADLVPAVMALRKVTNAQEVGRVRGRDLEHATYQHPFLDRNSPVVLAPYVSATDGTGFVHTAPGHGAEDYQTGRAYGLPTLSPVDASGRFTEEAPEWLRGKTVFAGNPDVVAHLKTSGHLYHEFKFEHSYPHCWRCKKPVIFRATEQWFIGVDRENLRGKTLQAIDEVAWVPSWGESRIEAMVGQRPDWCVSRQRSWGVPIPALSDTRDGAQHLTAASVRFVRDLFQKEGADAWYSREVSELVPPDLDTTAHPVEHLAKGTDILDVWFESGSSHRSVLDEPSFGLGGSPAYLYLEGSDQHRGWFQSSILTSVGSRGRAPFETVLTHGFVVDEKGEKMSKSVGNTISAVKATEQYGADVLRLYVASMDFSDDIRMSEKGIKEVAESYRKIRNTFRYLLGNLKDYDGFNPESLDPSTLHEFDLWALGQLNALIRDVRASYEAFEFYKVYQRIYQFCSVTLSSLYLDVLKDRLYAEAPEGPDRRAAQFVLARLHDSLTRLLGPILPHTTEELWELLPGRSDKPSSVHLAEFPEPDPRFDDPQRDERWKTLLAVRDEVLRVLEKLRAAKVIGSAQEASVLLGTDDQDLLALIEGNPGLLTTLAIVSELKTGAPPVEASMGVELPSLRVFASRSSHPKCERCWNLRPTVGSVPEHPSLCHRCAGVLHLLNPRSENGSI